MRYSYQEFKELVPEAPKIEQLAEELSIIGFETEVVNDTLITSLTANRRVDCTNLAMLAFDYAAVKDLNITKKPTIEPGKKIAVTLDQINKILGASLTPEQYKQIERLGFEVNTEYVIVPTFRTDLTNAADVAEEAIRLNGYHQLHVAMLDEQSVKPSPDYQKELGLKLMLANLGMIEAITTSFINKGQWEIKNPINSQERYLRSTLEDGLLQALAKNPFLKRAMFFEIGQVFLDQEQTNIGVIIAGYKNIEQWQDKLSKLLQTNFTLQPTSEEKIQHYDVKQGKVYFGEIAINSCPLPTEQITVEFPLPQIKPISKFPPLVRDFTLIGVEQSIHQIIEKLASQLPEILFAEVIDQYHNSEINETSFTIRIFLQKMESSFTDEEINILSQKLADLLKPYQKG